MLIYYGETDFKTFSETLIQDIEHARPLNILIVASVTFVSYEGFQLVINAVNEMDNPDKNIPRAIYSALILVALIYFIISLASVVAIPVHDLI